MLSEAEKYTINMHYDVTAKAKRKYIEWCLQIILLSSPVSQKYLLKKHVHQQRFQYDFWLYSECFRQYICIADIFSCHPLKSCWNWLFVIIRQKKQTKNQQ